MKFLLTGSVRSDKGPRLIVTFGIVFLLLFVLAHGIREITSTGFFPNDVIRNLHGDGSTPASKSLLLLLEDTHIDLVLFSMTILFLGSLLFQAKLRPGAKRTWIMLVSFSALAYVLTRPLVIFVPIAAPLVTISGLLLHLSLFGIMIVILIDLYGKRAHDMELAEGGPTRE